MTGYDIALAVLGAAAIMGWLTAIIARAQARFVFHRLAALETVLNMHGTVLTNATQVQFPPVDVLAKQLEEARQKRKAA